MKIAVKIIVAKTSGESPIEPQSKVFEFGK